MFITTRAAVEWLANDGWRELFDPRIRLRVEVPVRRAHPLSYLDRVVGLYRGTYGFRADVLHVQEIADSFLNYLLLRLRRVPLVLTVHDPLPHLGEEAYFIRYFEKRKARIFALRKRADWIIVQGVDVKEQLLKAQPDLCPGRIAVIPHGPITHLLRWRCPEYSERPGMVLFYGRMKAYKGLSVLMEAWQKVRQACSHARLVIAGRGPDLSNHRDRILADPQCELREGLVSTEDTARLFAEASIVAFPYVEATQSGPLAIALAFGKPTVVTRVGAMLDMVDENRSALVVPPRDPEALADAIIRLLRDEELRHRMAHGTVELSETRLAWKTLASQIEDVYKRAIEFHRSR